MPIDKVFLGGTAPDNIKKAVDHIQDAVYAAIADPSLTSQEKTTIVMNIAARLIMMSADVNDLSDKRMIADVIKSIAIYRKMQ